MSPVAFVHEPQPNWYTRLQSEMLGLEGKIRQPNRDGLKHRWLVLWFVADILIAASKTP